MSKFNVGDRVKTIKKTYGDIPAGSCGVVTRSEPAGVHMRADSHPKTNDIIHDRNGAGYWYVDDHLALIQDDHQARPVSKQGRLIAAKEAELARLKEAAAKRAKLAAERKAKAEQAKVLAGLSVAGKRVVAMLQSGAASDFGCQRDNVILLAAAITGDKADAIKKALA